MGINDPSQGMWQIDLAVLPLSLGSADRQTHEQTREKEAPLFVAPAVFMAQDEAFGLECFQIRSIKANNHFLIVQLCCRFLGLIISERDHLYEKRMEALEGFGDGPDGDSDSQRNSKTTLRHYCVKRGAQATLAHTQGTPGIRKRSRKPKPDQLALF